MSGTWVTRVWQEFRAGNLTRAARDVLPDPADLPGAGRPDLPEPRHPGRARRLPRQHRFPSPAGRPRPGAGQLGRTPGQGRVAQPEELEQYC